MMARVCTICEDPEVQEINRRLIRGDSIAGIAREFAVSEDALGRHKAGHIPATLEASPSTLEIANADNLLDELRRARQRTYGLLDKAEEAACVKVYGAPVQYLREIREQIRLLAELEGRLASQPQVNILINPEWIELRTLIVKALEPYPQAREAVVRALP